MQSTSAVFINLNEVLTFCLDIRSLIFSPHLPGFLRDQFSLSGKLVGLIWPFEIFPSFEWGEKEDFISWVCQEMEQEKAGTFPIFCLKNREDPSQLWEIRGQLDLSLSGSIYFTGVNKSLEFAREAGISHFASFPLNL